MEMYFESNLTCQIDLGLDNYNCLVRWVDMPGMKWYNVVSLVHGSINLRGIPKAVLLHCGGNDIGDVPCGAVSSDEIYNYN
jgi:hypothetical protein